MRKFNNPRDALRYHVSSAIERGEREAIVAHDRLMARDSQITLANARLIAAAPDLLAALERARFILESPTIAHLVNGAGTLDSVRAAIAKARGEG